MRAYRTEQAVVFEDGGKFYPFLGLTWDELVRADQHFAQGDVHEIARLAQRGPAISFDPSTALAPIVSQEVWAAGVTYFRSREARMSESKDAGGGDFMPASMTPAAPSSSSKPPAVASSAPARQSASAATPAGPSPSRS